MFRAKACCVVLSDGLHSWQRRMFLLYKTKLATTSGRVGVRGRKEEEERHCLILIQSYTDVV